MPKRYRRLRKDPEVDLTRLEECSDSELVSLCRELGHPHVGRHIHRDHLIDILLGEAEPPEDVLDLVRRKTYRKVKGRTLLRTVMNCDLHCPTCPHDKVVQCYAINHEVVDAVDLEST